jgi:hypothetical protein
MIVMGLDNEYENAQSGIDSWMTFISMPSAGTKLELLACSAVFPFSLSLARHDVPEPAPMSTLNLAMQPVG